MKVYKITLCYIDFDDCGDEIKDMIEGANLGNHVSPGDIMSMEVVDIGEWEDDNPLNNRKTAKKEFERLFPNNQL